jgi:hypothetical protein
MNKKKLYISDSLFIYVYPLNIVEKFNCVLKEGMRRIFRYVAYASVSKFVEVGKDEYTMEFSSDQGHLLEKGGSVLDVLDEDVHFYELSPEAKREQR